MMLAGLAKLAAAVAVAASLHLPYADPNQAGWLTLCGTNLKPVTSGSLTGKPFVWRVVSDVPAAKGYFVKGAKATMFAYQPRPGTPPGAWSGTVMGAASYYRNPAHPMAQFTPIDPALTQMTLAYPPVWDHLIELRLYLSAPQTPVLMFGYAAADIQVTGSTWHLVAGGHSSCTAGQVQAVETSVGMPGSRNQPKPPSTTSPGASPAASSSPSPTGSPSPSRSPGSSPSSASTAATTPAGSSTPVAGAPISEPTGPANSSLTGVVTGMAIGVALIFMAIIVRLLWRRQRRANG